MLPALAAAQHPTRVEGLRLLPTRPGGQLLEVSACTVHAVPAAGGGYEESLPCGDRLPPAGHDRLIWLEAEGMISPARFPVAKGPLPPADLPLPMVPAGRLRWPAAARQAAGFSNPALQLYLLHLESHLKTNADDALEMARWAGLPEAEAGVPLPAGKVVALLFDDAGTLLAMSKPQEVSARRDTDLALAPPDPAFAQLFVELERPGMVARADFRQTAVALDLGDGERRDAGALLITGRQVIGLFYDLPAKRGRLEAVAGNARLQDYPLRLAAGRVLYQQARLEALPSLRVRIELPASLRALPLAVEVLDGEQPLRRVELTAQAREARVDLLPPIVAEVLLQASPYVFRQPADLRRGDAEVVFAPQPLTVHGTVYRGEEAAAASLVFTGIGGAGLGFTVETDPAGRYETTFWQPGNYQVAIHFRADLPPYTEEVEIPDRADHTLDLRAPGANLRVKVLDAASGEAITRPTLYLRHRRPDAAAEDHEFAAEGEVIDLPPFDAGVLEVSASAHGYLRSPPIGLQVDGGSKETEPIEISLAKATAARRVALRDSAGRPLAGVAARAQFELGGASPVWEGISDREGMLEVPQEAMGSFLVLRADQSAASVRLLDKEALDQAEDPIVFLLMPGSPLQLRTLGLGNQGRSAALALWLDGQLISDDTLAFLCGSGFSDVSGSFVCATPMPVSSLQVLAWEAGHKPPDMIHAATLPAIRQGPVEIQVIE